MRGRQAVWERIERASPVEIDLAIAAAILSIGLLDLIFFPDPAHPTDLPTLCLFSASALSLALRRKWLWATLITFHVAQIVGLAAGFPSAANDGTYLVAPVVVFTVAERTPAVLSALVAAAETGLAIYPFPAALKDWVGAITFLGSLFGLFWFAGWAQRRRRLLTSEVEGQTAQLRAERERLAELAVATERGRIARELRSLVIQGIELITARAHAAESQLDSRPDDAPRAIALVEETGRWTLVEMRRLLGVLRRADDAGASNEGDVVDTGETALDMNTPPEDEGNEPKGQSRHGTGGSRAKSAKRLMAQRWVVDWVIVGLVAGFMAIDFWTRVAEDTTFRGWLPPLLAIVIVGALVFRRIAPLPVLSTIAITHFLWILTTNNFPGAARTSLLIAVYTVAAYRPAHFGIAAVGMALLAWSPVPIEEKCSCLMLIGLWSVFAVVAGHSMREGRRLIGNLRAQGELLVRTRAERTRQAVHEERTRVAREMHDVVAHAITAIVLQAGGARAAASTDPAQALVALDTVDRLGDKALTELRSLVETLEPGVPNPEPMPRYGDRSVDALVSEAKGEGLSIELHLEGDPGLLDRGMEISLYRIVQEALTNVRRHAPGATTTIRIHYGPDVVEAEIVNGPGRRMTAEALPGAGQGLIGIAERAAVFGGRTEATATADGGFRVCVRLPMELVPA